MEEDQLPKSPCSTVTLDFSRQAGGPQQGPHAVGMSGHHARASPWPCTHQTQLDSLFADPQLVAGVREQRTDPESLLEGRQQRQWHTHPLRVRGADSLSGSDGIPEGCRNTALSESQGIQLKGVCSCSFVLLHFPALSYIRSIGIPNPKTPLYHLPPPWNSSQCNEVFLLQTSKVNHKHWG